MTVFKFFLVIFCLLVMFIGIYLIYRDQKSSNKKVALSDDAYDKDGKPVVPRHLRKFAKARKESKSEKTENNLNDIVLTQPDFDEQSLPVDSGITKRVDSKNDLVNNTTKVKIDSVNTSGSKSNNQFTNLYTSADDISGKDDTLKSNLEIPPVVITSDDHPNVGISVLNDDISSKEDDNEIDLTDELNIDAFDKKEKSKNNNNLLNDMLAVNNTALDESLKTEEKEQHSPLTDAEDNINISILPNNEFSYIDGDKLLELVENYGFKFGAMNMFHRYENKDGTGILWFSMMGLTKKGIVPFDITTLAESDELKGLVMFLPLPHPNVLQGFDSMMSIANMMARQLGSYVVDEEGDSMTNEYKKKLRSLLQTTLVDEDKS